MPYSTVQVQVKAPNICTLKRKSIKKATNRKSFAGEVKST
jgi:hypothetical protein